MLINYVWHVLGMCTAKMIGMPSPVALASYYNPLLRTTTQAHPFPGARPLGVPGKRSAETDIRPTVTTTRVPELVQVATRYSLLRGFPRSREASWVPTYTCYLSIGRDTHKRVLPYV